MRFVATPLADGYIVELDRLEDERGFFARSFCSAEFAAHELAASFPQCNVSYNARRGTLRGMHYQREPYAEAKVVRCTRGAIYDVIVDIRPGSPTFRRWFAVDLTADNRRMLYVPQGHAHGFQTLRDDSEVFYMMSETYHPEAAAGIRWNDAMLNVSWPLQNPIVSPKDMAYPDLAMLS